MQVSARKGPKKDQKKGSIENYKLTKDLLRIQSVIPSVSCISATDMTRTIASWSGAAKWSKNSVLGSNDDDDDDYCPFGPAKFSVYLSYTVAFHITFT